MSKACISVRQFQNMLEILNPSMDDFLYLYDVKNDFFCISPSAVDRFYMERSYFYDVEEHLRKIVHSADFRMLENDLLQVLNEEKEFHNMQYRWLGRDGKAVWINCRGQITQDEMGNPEFLIGCINEIGRAQEADNISGLLGESGLQQEINKLKNSKISGFLMRLGIDNFREINENKGIEYGDLILRRTAECIQSFLSPEQKLYRIVADEFAVVDLSGRDARDARGLYYNIRWKTDRLIEENGYEVFYTLSAGILELDALENQGYDNMSMISEFTLAEAKKRGKNQSYTFKAKDYDVFKRKRKLIHVMRQSVNNNFEGFEAYFQPIMNITDGKLANAETLLRYKTEEFGWVSPVEFIPLLEESGLIIPVGRWVLRQAMAACKQIRSSIPNFCISVNVSTIQILKSNVLGDIQEGLREFDLSPSAISVELTESGFFETDEYYMRFFNGLRDIGIKMALDDFGTGYSNFHYLYNLNPDTIKIDRSFTLKAMGNDYEYGLLKHMVDMAHSVNLKMCIEGIETEEELIKVNAMGSDYIQGYFFGSPCSFEAFVAQHVS